MPIKTSWFGFDIVCRTNYNIEWIMKYKIKVKKLYDGFLKMNEVDYLDENGKSILNHSWNVVTRMPSEEYEEKLNNGTLSSSKADGINILPYFEDDKGQIFVVIALEFRYLAGGWIFSTPAGLTEKDLTEEETAVKELYEETGGELVKGSLKKHGTYFTTIGLTSERISMFSGKIKKIDKQHLESDENIKRAIVSLKDIEKILNGEKLALKDIDGKIICDENGNVILNYSLDLKGVAILEPFVLREKLKNRNINDL